MALIALTGLEAAMAISKTLSSSHTEILSPLSNDPFYFENIFVHAQCACAKVQVHGACLCMWEPEVTAKYLP